MASNTKLAHLYDRTDLITAYDVSITCRLLIFKRNCNNQSRLLSQHNRRDVLFRVTVSSLNELGQVSYSKSTGIKSHSFTKDEVPSVFYSSPYVDNVTPFEL